MKKKGMHQQPNAFTPSTGSSQPVQGQSKTYSNTGFNPSSSPPSWQKPGSPTTENKGFNKNKKAA